MLKVDMPGSLGRRKILSPVFERFSGFDMPGWLGGLITRPLLNLDVRATTAKWPFLPKMAPHFCEFDMSLA